MGEIMKAWYLDIKDDPDQGAFIVFAKTRNEARAQASSHDLMYDSWLDVQAVRHRSCDGLEKLDEAHLTLRLWREEGWRWWDIDYPDQDESTDEQFLEWYNTTFGDGRIPKW